MIEAALLGQAAARRLPGPPITRFAPSPTGYLHLGHVVNAIFVWGVARAAGGRVLLRIEDHDRVRCRPEFESACLEDLAWLGFVPDEGLTPVLRQQDHNRRYARALARLVAADRVYACACSRREIGGERYDGACRTRVSLIVRGEDLIESTGRQLALARLLGRREPPVFLHHPLIYNSPGVKLSKSAGDAGVRALRDAGVPPEVVVGRAAAAVGLVPRGVAIPALDVQRLFGG